MDRPEPAADAGQAGALAALFTADARLTRPSGQAEGWRIAERTACFDLHTPD